MIPGLSIRELAGIAFPNGEGLLLMLRGYFDDSGTHLGSEVVVCGGLVGTVAQWEGFERAWAAKLAAPLPGKPPLKKFHLAPCQSGWDEYASYTRAESDAAIHDFRQIIMGADLISVAFTVEQKAWDELVTGKDRDLHGSALEVCVKNCIEETMRIAGAHPQGDKVAVAFDRGFMTSKLKEITDPYTYSLGAPRLVSVNFLTVADTLGLQGADIPATEAYWHAKDVLNLGLDAPPRAHLKHYLSGTRAASYILDREAIAQLLSVAPSAESPS